MTRALLFARCVGASFRDTRKFYLPTLGAAALVNWNVYVLGYLLAGLVALGAVVLIDATLRAAIPRYRTWAEGD